MRRTWTGSVLSSGTDFNNSSQGGVRVRELGPATQPAAPAPPAGFAALAPIRTRADPAAGSSARSAGQRGAAADHSRLHSSASTGVLSSMPAKTSSWRTRGAAAPEPAGASSGHTSPTSKKAGNSTLPLWRPHVSRPVSRRLITGCGLLAALLVWLLASSAVRPGSREAAAPLPAAAYGSAHQGPAPAPGLESGSGAPTMIEFTAQGLFVPLRDALSLTFPLHPKEQPLLDLMPTPQELATPPVAPPRQTIEQFLQKQEQQLREQAERARQETSMALAQAQYERQRFEASLRAAGITQGAAAAWPGVGTAGAAGGQGSAPQQLGDVQAGQQAEQAAAFMQLGGQGPKSQAAGGEAAAAGTVRAGAGGGTGSGPQPGAANLHAAQHAAAGQDLTARAAAEQDAAAQAAAAAAAFLQAGAAAERPARQQQGAQVHAVDAGVQLLERKLLSQMPEMERPAIRLLVGVTSACCTEKAYRRRRAVRETWAQLAARHHAGRVDVKFVLAQPDSAATLERWLPLLEEEARQHNDTVVVRGADTYRQLPNKTVRLLRYAVAHPRRYTHVLKTDDDCYVRLPHLLKALEVPDPANVPFYGPGRFPPYYSDGMSTYSLRDLTRKMGPGQWLDDGEGNSFSLAQLVNATRTGMHPWGWPRPGAKPASGSASSSDSSIKSPGAASGKPSPSSVGMVGAAAAAMLREHTQRTKRTEVRLSGVYMGCVENKNGFWPIRDPASKWFMPTDVLPDSALPHGVNYHAGWGYLLSRDLAEHAVKKVNLWQKHPDLAPAWFRPMDWEDVLVGFLVMDRVAEPEDHPGFRAAWRACPNTTAVVHLDVDAPVLMGGLYAQDVSGLWDKKAVQCSSGSFLPGDYTGWKTWRDSLEDVERL